MNTKKFDRRDQLIEAALDEFIDKTYDQASLNQIIKSAHLSKGVFYYHFKNKEALYIALLKNASEKKWAYIQKHTSTLNFDTSDIFDKFLVQTEISVGFAKKYPKYNQLAQMFLKEKDNPIYRIVLSELNTSGNEVLETMIRDAYVKGEISHDYPLEFTIQMLSHLFTEFHTIFVTDTDFDLDKITATLKTYVSFMRHGLTPK